MRTPTAIPGLAAALAVLLAVIILAASADAITVDGREVTSVNSLGVAAAILLFAIAFRDRIAVEFNAPVVAILAILALGTQFVVYAGTRGGENEAVAGIVLIVASFLVALKTGPRFFHSALALLLVGIFALTFLPWWALTAGDENFWDALSGGGRYEFIGTDDVGVYFVGADGFALTLAVNCATVALVIAGTGKRGRRARGPGNTPTPGRKQKP